MKRIVLAKSLCSTLAITVFGLVIHSCATVFSGANQNLKVKSEPAGASVYINGSNTYQYTPCKVKVERRQKRPFQFRKTNEVLLEVKKEGYEEARVSLESSFNVVAAASIFFAGVPFLIDWMTGAHLKYQKNNYLYLKKTNEPIYINRENDFLTVSESFEKEFYGNLSDVDYNIPETKRKINTRFALIIGNEDYSRFQPEFLSEIDVDYAKNDAQTFRAYALKTLGIPDENIIFYTDATLATMKRGINKLNLLAKNSFGEAELYFYYAGHGLPDEYTKESYILPVDVLGTDLDMAIKLQDVYSKLAEYPTAKVTCILDCCFSGGARNMPLVSSRGVKIIPKKNELKGNMVVFSASLGDQSANSYAEKSHGMLTYFFLKKLQETKGEVTYGELYSYLVKNIPLKSIIENDKEQTPHVIISPDCTEDWKKIKF